MALKYAKRALAAGHERVAAGTPAPASLLDEVETDVFEALIKKATGEADALEIPASILEKQAHIRSVFGYEAERLIPQLHQANADLATAMAKIFEQAGRISEFEALQSGAEVPALKAELPSLARVIAVQNALLEVYRPHVPVHVLDNPAPPIPTDISNVVRLFARSQGSAA